MTWYHYWPDPKPVGEFGDKKVGLSSSWTPPGSAQLPGRRILILPFVTALLEVSWAPMTSALWPLLSEWRGCLPMKWYLKRSPGEFFSADPSALVFIVHPQSSGVSGTQKPQLYPMRTMMLKLRRDTAANVAHHREREGLDLSAKSCIFQMWFCTFQYLTLFINVTWRLAVTYSRLLQR